LEGLRKRGAGSNPKNRFEKFFLERDPEETAGLPETEVYRDSSRTVLARNTSPDVHFEYSLNPYRGCEHGCVYCYARPSHEYLGFSAGLDFESRIAVKEDAPELLRRAFLSPRWRPQPVALSGNTDCYQPLEKRLAITRRCLDVFLQFRNPVEIITKSSLVIRDLDLLMELAKFGLVAVSFSITSLKEEITRRMEPRASAPRLRLKALEALGSAGIPAGVLVAPVVPGLTDEEIPSILKAARDHGALWAGYVLLRLPPPVDELFVGWLKEEFPERAERVLHLIRQCRAGRLSDSRFEIRMRGEGLYAEQLRLLFEKAKRKIDFPREPLELTTSLFRKQTPLGHQLDLF
jgi:DNA repair photolyase